jgi:hypothetical protein
MASTAKSTKKPSKRRWSQHVTETSDALDIASGTLAGDDPKTIAHDLKVDAESSTRRKSNPFRSAMSMLSFFINRAGRTLPAKRKATLEAAKGELRREFGRDDAPTPKDKPKKKRAPKKKATRKR